MHLRVAAGAQGNQVVFDIRSRMAPEEGVMHLQVLHAAARLTAPAIAREDFPALDAILVGSETNWWRFAEILGHDLYWLMPETNASCSCFGKNS